MLVARRARLMLVHVFHQSPHYAEYGPGATGIGWELGLVGLAIHLEHPEEPMFDEAELVASPEGKAFISGSSNGWAHHMGTRGTGHGLSLSPRSIGERGGSAQGRCQFVAGLVLRRLG